MSAEHVRIGHVIIQAGGKGMRLGSYGRNKPKCLAPVAGRPLLYHSFDHFPDAKFLVVLDYRKDVVARYLDVFPPAADVEIVAASGAGGTLGGLAAAVARIPDGAPVALIWCDLTFDAAPPLLAEDAVVVGVTDAFACRWSMQANGRLVERRSDRDGVAGLFVFPRKEMLAGLPIEGEFVEWLAHSGLKLLPSSIAGVAEIGTQEALEARWSAAGHARFFNSVTLHDDRVVKRARLPAWRGLLDDEAAWYGRALCLGFHNAPRVLGTDPLTLERLRGRHPFDLPPDPGMRAAVLERIVERLQDLHDLDRAPACPAVMHEVYFTKTLQRLDHVARLLPDLRRIEHFRINGVACRNILHDRHFSAFTDLVAGLTGENAPAPFRFIHGDPTFSNILVDDGGEPWFIDPRGRFGASRFLGDPQYDWAKLYYSVVGDYDNFNRRHFTLDIAGHDVDLRIRPGGWAHLSHVFRDVCGTRMHDIRLLHALIWLSLSGYVSDDYDSIVAAFFMGLLTLEEAIAPASA